MNKSSVPAWLPWIALTEAVGALAGFLSREGTRLYNLSAVKPALSPPGVVFPIVWVILYALMGVGARRVAAAPPSRERTAGMRLVWIQLAFNFLWSLLFFNLRAYGFAFVWLVVMWLLILTMTLTWRRVDRTAAALQIPYLIWVAFAGYLNLGVWLLN